MDDMAKGFRLGEGDFFAWGTRFDAVVRGFEAPATPAASSPAPALAASPPAMPG